MAGKVFVPYENTVKMRVVGLFSDKFIDMAGKSGVIIENLYKSGLREVTATIRVSDIHKLRRIAVKTMCRVYFSDRKGWKFILKNIASRIVLPVGLAAGIVFVSTFTRYIRIIDVYGEGIDKTEIINKLESYGVHEGIKNDGEFFRNVEESFLIDNPEYSFIALKNKGVYLDIHAVKRSYAPDPYDPDLRCDIVAGCDCVITSVKVYEGTAKVEPGQTVKKGQVLIEGSENGKYIAALGDVEGRVWYTAAAEKSIKAEKILRTGQYNVNRRLKVPWKYVIMDKSSSFDKSETETRSISLLNGFFLGVQLENVTEYEIETQYENIPLSELKSIAGQQAFELAIKKLPLGYVPENITYSGEIKDGNYICRCIFEVIRPVGHTKYY